jgi:flavin reductase (DIM6/NTAB) family NADH-FMN oxidoreductase RutF
MTDMAHLAAGRAEQSGEDATFRELMSRFPSGVTVVTTCARDGSPRGLTCTSLCGVSLRPPMLLACLGNESETLAVLLRNGAFAVNLLHAGGQAAAQVFASPIGDRFEQVTWERTSACGLPWLRSDAHAVAECLVVDTVQAGDHTVVFGEVDNVVTTPERPLLYGLRQYGVWSPSTTNGGPQHRGQPDR